VILRLTSGYSEVGRERARVVGSPRSGPRSFLPVESRPCFLASGALGLERSSIEAFACRYPGGQGCGRT